MERLSGVMTLPGTTALPAGSTARVTVVPASGRAGSKPVAEGEFPAKTGDSIPFKLTFPESKVASGGEYLVLAQVLSHGKVWYSNLTSPLRISFVAEPGELHIPLREEPH